MFYCAIAEAEKKWQDILTDRKKRKCMNSVTAYCDRMAKAYSENPPSLPQQSLKKRLLENKTKLNIPVHPLSLPPLLNIERCFPPLPMPGENGVKQLKPVSHLAQSTDKSTQLIKQLAQPSRHLVQSSSQLAQPTNQLLLSTNKYVQPSSISILSANKPQSASKSIQSASKPYLINIPTSPVNQLSQLASKSTQSANISNQPIRKSIQLTSILTNPASKSIQPVSKSVDNSENDEMVEEIGEETGPRWSGIEDVMFAYSRYWSGKCRKTKPSFVMFINTV